MIAAIYARADVWLRRAVRMAGEVTDRVLRISYVKGAVRLPAILFTVSAVPCGGKPPGTQRGGPAGIAGTDLPYHGAVWRHGELLRGRRQGQGALPRSRRDPSRHTHPAYALRPR